MKNDETKTLAISIILAALLLVIPYLIRSWEGNPYPVNSDTYLHMRLYDQGNALLHDDLESRTIPINIMYLIPFKYQSFLFGELFTILIGIFSIIIGYAILRKYNISEKIIFAALLLLIASPIFISVFMGFNPYAVVIFLSLLTLYFMLEEKYWIGGLISIILPFIDIYGAIISFIFIFVYMSAGNKPLKRYLIFIIPALIAITASIIIHEASGFSILAHMQFEKTNILTDIGADTGFSFASIILSAVGLIVLWEKGWKNTLIYASLILFFIISIFNEGLRIYLNFLLGVYAGFAFIYLQRRKWSIPLIKKITILLIICSILFTTLVYVTKLVKSEPNPNYVEGLAFLNKQALPNETIMSSIENGYIIEYYTGRRAFIDDYYIVHDQRIDVMDQLATTRNLEKAETILTQYDIKYFFVDGTFKSYLEEKEGLLFLIQTSNKFKSVYKNEAVEIFLYIR